MWWWLAIALAGEAEVTEVGPPHLGEVLQLSPETRTAMTGVSWREGCPVGLDDLRMVRFQHHTHDGGERTGELIVHREVADDVLKVMLTLHQARFSFTRVEPVHRFGGSDDASMEADNTSGFNCRPVSGGARFSEHSYGHAIDINPLRNPWVRGSKVEPEAGRAWLARDDRPGVIRADGPVVAAFKSIGWRWGGFWRSSKDYQHFSKTGR